MTRYVIGATVLILVGLIYWLSAGPQVLTKAQEASSAELVYTWIDTQHEPVPVDLATADKKAGLFYATDRRSYGTVTHNENTIDVRWFDTPGTPIGSLSEKWINDVALPKYFLDEEQQLIAVDILNRLRVFDRTGLPLRQFQLFESVDYASENALFAYYCPAAKSLFTGLTAAAVPYTSQLKLISLEGDELWQKHFPEWQINTIHGTADASLLIVSLYKTRPEENWFIFQTLFFDQSGRQIGELPVQFKTAVVDPTGTYVVLLDRQRAYVFDVNQNALISEFKTENEHRLFHTAAFLDDSHLVLQEGKLNQIRQRWVYTNVELRTVSRQGKQIDLKQLSDITVFEPVLSYNVESKTLFIGHSTGWQEFAVHL